jgi:hypothetical protein
MIDISNINIEKNIPAPAERIVSNGISGFLLKLKVGESFVIEHDAYTNISQMASRQKQQGKCEFVSRGFHENGIHKHRFWRTK